MIYMNTVKLSKLIEKMKLENLTPDIDVSKIEIKDKKTLTQEEMASLFTYTFVPDYTNAQELIKVIIESPSKDYIENVSMVNDDDFYALKLRVDRDDKSFYRTNV